MIDFDKKLADEYIDFLYAIKEDIQNQNEIFLQYRNYNFFIVV